MGQVALRRLKRRYVIPECENEPEQLTLNSINGRVYPFESLVFEGCGVKIYSYFGALKVLERTGVLDRIRRFAGAGTGALLATLVALGYDSDEIQSLFSGHLTNILIEAVTGINRLGNNLIRFYGWNLKTQLYSWIGDLVHSKFTNRNLTFQELYELTNVELCIVVTNVNTKTEQFWHPKTTPNFRIRTAAVISMIFPGVFTPIQNLSEEISDHYLDGGAVCNYPIHCFDGWWLSMKPKDSFLDKLKPTFDCTSVNMLRFQRPDRTPNLTTLGFLTYDDSCDSELYQELNNRIQQIEAQNPIPRTTLGQKYFHLQRKRETTKMRHFIFRTACLKLGQLLEEIRDGDILPMEEFIQALINGCTLEIREIQLLFGCTEVNRETLYQIIEPLALNGELRYNHMLCYIERKYVTYYQKCFTFRSDVQNLHTYFGIVADIVNRQSNSFTRSDVDRTIAIYTGHINCNDLNLEEADQIYLIRQGWNSTVAYLRSFGENQKSQNI